MSISPLKRINHITVNSGDWLELTGNTPGVSVNLISEIYLYLMTQSGDYLGALGNIGSLHIYYTDITHQLMEYTANTKLDILLSDADLWKCYLDDISGFLPVNINNQLRLLSIKNKPTSSINITCILDEVEIAETLHLTHANLNSLTHENISQYKHGYIS